MGKDSRMILCKGNDPSWTVYKQLIFLKYCKKRCKVTRGIRRTYMRINKYDVYIRRKHTHELELDKLRWKIGYQSPYCLDSTSFLEFIFSHKNILESNSYPRGWMLTLPFMDRHVH